MLSENYLSLKITLPLHQSVVDPSRVTTTLVVLAVCYISVVRYIAGRSIAVSLIVLRGSKFNEFKDCFEHFYYISHYPWTKLLPKNCLPQVF